MARMSVAQLAAKHRLTTRVILQQLRESGFPVLTFSSMVEEEEVRVALRSLTSPAPPWNPTSPAPPRRPANPAPPRRAEAPASVQRGLLLLRNGMARHAQTRLSEYFGATWWDEAVLPSFTTESLKFVRQRLEESDEKDLSSVDIQGLLALYRTNLNVLLQPGDQVEGRKILDGVHRTRNRWAHQEQFSKETAFSALKSMRRLAELILAPEATKISELTDEIREIESGEDT